MKKLSAFILFLLFTLNLSAQNQGKYWYFGNFAGLNFNTTPPSILTDGQITTWEGCAAISDQNGSLLFYTDGSVVKNKNHQSMPNANGSVSLGGNSSSTQSAIVVPDPSNTNRYYIFTTSALGAPQVARYSIVDMSLDGGLGDVVVASRATTILSGVTEQIQATQSADGTFWWIVVVKAGTNSYYAYKLTSSGFDINNPVISSVGTSVLAGGTAGHLKFNPAKGLMVRADYNGSSNSFVELFDFNSSTGVISNPIKISHPLSYGVEFSPNARFLYVTGYNGKLVQYDLNAGSTASQIQASAVELATTSAYGAIQSAPDGKLYVARWASNQLGVINSPNSLGIASNYVANGQSLGTKSSFLGLPNIVSSFVSTGPPQISGIASSNITGTTATISANVTSDGGEAITERGFYYGTTATPTTNKSVVSGTTGALSTNLTGLTGGTTYYFRGFATNSNGTSYTTDGTFTTNSTPSFTCPEIDRRNNGNGQASSCAGVNGTPMATNVVGTAYATVPSTAKTGDITFRWQSLPSAIPVISKVWINGVESAAQVGPPSVTTQQGGFYKIEYCFYNVNLPNAGSYTLEFTDPQTGNVLGRCTFDGSSNVSTSEPTLTTNTPPSITAMVNQSTSGTTPTTAQSFTLADTETAAANLTVTASSSNTTLIPNSNIVISGTGATRNVVVSGASGQYGTATITLTVTDADGATATSTFTVTVNDPTCSTFSPSDFRLNGNATLSNNIITLTSATGNQRGGAWNVNKVFLDKDFDISSRINLGTNDATGADGIAFVLQNQSINAGSTGGGLGYQGITPSFAVEFDTFYNGPFEPVQDHMAIIANGVAAGAHNTYATPFEVQMEDGQWHNVRFVWTASTKNFQAWYDGVKRFDITVDLKATIFNNADYVYWGFTAATGGSVNLQRVEITNYCYTQQASITPQAGTNNNAASLNICQGADVVLEASLANTYQWFKNNVAIAGATQQTLTVAESGSYKVETVTNGVTTVSEASTVTVSSLPSISYAASTYSFIRNNTITNLTPVLAAGSPTPSTYSVSPALPTGLTLNTSTGVISGRPTVLTATADYIITANTAAGCTTTYTLSLEVKNDAPPLNLVYNPNVQTVRQGTAITNMVPTVGGGAVITYTIAPSLPSGITIDATTGVISGTLSNPQTGSQVYTITASNTGGTAAATITLIYNSAPTDITLSATSIAENNSANATVGTLSSTDVDAGDTHTYTLVSGAGSTDNAAFNISGNSLRVNNALDFEAKSSYSIRVRTTDAGGLSYEKVFTVTVTDVDDTPAVITGPNGSGTTTGATAAKSIPENTTAVGSYTADETVTWSISGTDASKFTISTSGVLSFTTAPDHENPTDSDTNNTYVVIITATDAAGNTTTQILTLTVSNENEAPTDITLSATSIAENNSANATVGTMSSTDADAGDTHTYTLVSGAGSTDNAAFNISGNSLRVNSALNFEAKSSYSIRVRTTDAGGLSFEKVFTVTVTDVNEAPTDITLSATSIAENNSANATVGTMSSTDADAGDTHTYTLVSGAGSTDNAAFNISGNSLRVNSALNFEAKSSYSIRVRTTDAGGLSFEKVFTVTVTNVNEAPTDINSSLLAIYENNAANARIGILSSIDPDAGDSHTYTLVSGTGSNDNASFSISGNQLNASTVFRFNTQNTYSVRIRTTDAAGLFYEEAFAVTVLASPAATGTGNLPGTSQITAAGNNVTISKGFSSQLNVTGSGIVSYSWSPSTGLSATNVANPVASPTETTTYAVTVTNSSGASTVVYVTVNVVEDYNVKPTNIITPNGDGINDFWVIDNLDSYPDNEVQIFDKAGRILYQVRDYQNNWDGRINSNLLAEGTYYYVISFGAGKKTVKGYITIIRD